MSNVQSDEQPNTFGYGDAFGFSATFWALVLLTGIGAGIAGGALMALLRAAEHLAWAYNTGTFLEGVSHSSPGRRVAVVLCAGVMVGVSRLILRRPASGHPGDIAAAIWFRSGEVPFWNTVSKAVVSILAVALGAAVGREAAPKQAGGAIASLLAGWGKLSSSQRRLLVACGTGAGMGAVYNVPLGGAIFAVEVLLGQLSLSLVLPALATSLIAVAVSWLFLPDQPTYFFPAYPFSYAAMPGAAVLGFLVGWVSVGYVKAIAWAEKSKPRGRGIIIAPILVFAALGLASIAYPQLLGNGKNVVELAFVDQLSLPLMAILLVPRALATIACLAAGTPGGLLTPTMTVGALMGGLIGHLWNKFLPGQAGAAYAIFGAGAFLAASSKGPLSSLVLIFELTNHVTSVAVPLMLAIVVATLVARHFDPRSIYSARIHSGRLAALQMNHGRIISAATPYPEVLKRLLLLPGKKRLVYVVDEAGVLVGEISGERAGQAESFARPLQTASADDLATPAKAMSSDLSHDEMNRMLQAGQLAEMPVIDSASRRLVGLFPDNG